jgi:hypothetical protein
MFTANLLTLVIKSLGPFILNFLLDKRATNLVFKARKRFSSYKITLRFWSRALHVK